MLLDIRERQREVAQAQAAPAVPERANPQPPMFRQLHNMFGGGPFRPAAPEPVHYEPPRPPQFLEFGGGGDFDWINNPSMYPRCVMTLGSHSDSRFQLADVASLGHPFTRQMIATLTCGYCNNRLNSINDLRYHLSHVRYHSVFSCCGRFFRRETDLDQHRQAKYDHENEVVRSV